MKIKKLSKNLKPIYDLEITEGNIVASIDCPAGSTCPLAITFKYGLHHFKIDNELSLNSEVERFTNKDAHYPKEAGYVCNQTGHVVSGPLGKL